MFGDIIRASIHDRDSLNTSSGKSETLRVPVLVCGTPRSDPSSVNVVAVPQFWS